MTEPHQDDPRLTLLLARSDDALARLLAARDEVAEVLCGHEFDTLADALEQLRPDALVLFDDDDAAALGDRLAALRDTHPHLPILVWSTHCEVPRAVQAMRSGASTYACCQDAEEVGAQIERLVAACRHNRQACAEEERRHLMDAAVHAAANAIVITDRDGQILFVNDAFTRLTGYEADEAIGQNPRVLKSGQHGAAFYRQMWETILAGEVWQGRLVNRRKDGELYHERLTITPIRDADDRITHFIGVKEDESAQHQAATALLESNHQLQVALDQLRQTQQQVIQQERLRALGQMASGIAHDFNNVLTSILGFTQLLQVRPENLADQAKVKRYLEMIESSANDASKVVRRLREFYRPRGADECQDTCDLAAVVRRGLELTRPKWCDQARGSGASIEMLSDIEDVPRVRAGDSECSEVLTNLVFNAVDAMPEGGQIRVRLRPEQGFAVLQVEDTGRGMSEDVRRRCLEPFFSTKGELGTGLGLSVVFGVIQRCGGTIDIHSTPGEGTTFTVRLPTDEAAEPTRIGLDRPAPVAKLRALVVEPEPAVREVVQEYLALDGHEVHCAASADEALRLIAESPPDLIITARAVTGMSGDRLAEEARRQVPGLPVSLLTGFSEMISADELAASVDVILGKPITLDELRAAVARVVPPLDSA